MKACRLLALVVALLLAACATTSTGDMRAASDVVVELDVFSGRPNPTWTRTPAEAAELDRRIRGRATVFGP